MMTKCYLVRFDEINLKGKNRNLFEDILAKNIASAFKKAGQTAHVEKKWRRFLVRAEEKSAIKILNHTFGIVSYSPVIIVLRNLDTIKAHAVSLLKEAISEHKDRFLSFRVRARRSDKTFPLTSQQLNAELGTFFLQEIPSLKVSLTQNDLEMGVEIEKESAYLYLESITGLGGLPVGSSGRVLALLSGGIDSPVASWSLMKRGCLVDFIHFYSPPYTGPHNREKVIDLVHRLSAYQGQATLTLIPFTEIQELIANHVAELRTLLYRHAMHKIAALLAMKKSCLGLVTGDSLGQVASQTLSNLKTLDEGSPILILRPLLSFDKKEIIALAKKIGTYDISIRPHLDCCTLFQANNPATKSTTHLLFQVESKLNLQPLIERAIEHREELKID